MDSLEIELVEKELVVLEYAKLEKPKRKWYNPMDYKGAIFGLGYGLIWPTTVLAYLSSFSHIYDEFLPHESLQDNLVYYAFRIPSDFVDNFIKKIVDGTAMDNGFVGVSAYLMVWALAGHITEKTIPFVKKKILREK